MCGRDGRLDQRAVHENLTTTSFVVACDACANLAGDIACARLRACCGHKRHQRSDCPSWAGTQNPMCGQVRTWDAFDNHQRTGTVATRPAPCLHAIGPGAQRRAQTTPASRPLMRRRTRWEQHMRPASGVCAFGGRARFRRRCRGQSRKWGWLETAPRLPPPPRRRLPDPSPPITISRYALIQ